MKIKKKLLLSLLGLTSLSVVTPLALTSCNPNTENNQKTIVNFVDLSNYSYSTIYGEKTYIFESNANSTFKDKSESEIWSILEMTDNKNYISKENFKKLIEGLTFEDIDSENKLVANDITTAAVENENVNTKAEFINENSIDYLQISFTTNDKAEWQKDNSATITFKIAIKDWRIDFVDLTNFKPTEIDGKQTYVFKADANGEFKDKTEDEIWKLLGMENNHKGQISKESFQKLIKGLTFENIYDNQTNSNKLLYGEINSDVINENNINSKVEFYTENSIDYIKTTFTPKDHHKWNNEQNNGISFILKIRDLRINFINLNKFKSTNYNGEQNYVFVADANSSYKDKNELQIWTLLGMENNKGGEISIDSFDSIASNLVFENRYDSNLVNENTLSYKDIKTSLISGEQITSKTEFLTIKAFDCFKITFSLKDRFVWNNGTTTKISFIFKIKNYRIDFVDLGNFNTNEINNIQEYIFVADANEKYKNKTELEIWNLLNMESNKNGPISSNSFSDITNSLLFDNVFNNEISDNKLSFQDIKVNLIGGQEMSSKTEFVTEKAIDCFKIIFSPNDKYGWNNGSNANITFVIRIKSYRIDFVDLNNFNKEETPISSSYVFQSIANDSFKNKNEEEIWNMLNMSNNHIGPISKESFEKIVDGLSFDNIYNEQPNKNKLEYSAIDTNLIGSDKITSKTEYVNEYYGAISYFKITFSLNDKYGWNNGDSSDIEFIILINYNAIDIFDLSKYEMDNYFGPDFFYFESKANELLKGKSFEEIKSILNLNDPEFDNNWEINSKDVIDKIINGLTFDNYMPDNKNKETTKFVSGFNPTGKKLYWKDIDTTVVNNENVSTILSFSTMENKNYIRFQFSIIYDKDVVWDHIYNKAQILFFIEI